MTTGTNPGTDTNPGTGTDTNTLSWLLEDDCPGVRYSALLRWEGRDPASRGMQNLRRRCNEYAPVARMLEGVDDAITAGDYAKYRGAYWTLIFLADMMADGRDRRVRRLAEHVLGRQLDNGGFSPDGSTRDEIVCLTSNLLRALVTLGYGAHEGVARGYRRLCERILAHRGIPCIVLQHCLHTRCHMALPQTLRCAAAAPAAVKSADLEGLRQLLVHQIKQVRVYRYVHPEAKQYHEALKNRPKGATIAEFKKQYIADKKVRPADLRPKPGWLRFGFPRSYNPDALEAMLALAEAGADHARALDGALDHIEKLRRPDGRWLLQDSLNGKMLADIEGKGRPSKWVTLRAMIVLDHFGRR